MIPKNTLDLLEFQKLLRLISEFAYSDASRQSVADIHPLQDREAIEKRLGLIGEIRKMSQQGNRLRLSQFPDISLPLVRIRPEGAVLEAELTHAPFNTSWRGCHDGSGACSTS